MNATLPEPGAARPIIHVIDDDDAVLQGLAMLLASARFRANTYPSGLAFLDALPSIEASQIGCVLTDVRMPGLDGISLLHRLRDNGFDRPVIVMTAHGDIVTAVQAMKAGAADFIEKPFDDDMLLGAIETAIADADKPRLAMSHDSHVARHPEARDAARRIGELSCREREVLKLLTDGKPNKTIAYELGISLRTAEVHRARMMTRLGVRSLAEAVRLAVRAESAGLTNISE